MVFAPTYNKKRRFLFTGDGEPKKSDSELAVTDPATAPSTVYGLGVPAPTTPLTVELTPADPIASAPVFDPGNTSAVNDYVTYDTKTYICVKEIATIPAPLPTDTTYWLEVSVADYLRSTTYVYTWVTGWGEESSHGPETGVFEVLVGQHCRLSDVAPAPAGYNITAWRIYRLVSGTTRSEYQFVAERSLTDTDFDDTLMDSELGAALGTGFNSAPVAPWDQDALYTPGTRTTFGGLTYLNKKEVKQTPGPEPTDTDYWEESDNLSGLTALSNGVLAGFIENELFFTLPFAYYGWPPAYSQVTEYKIVALGAYNTTLAVLTEGNPYLVDGINPESSTLVRLNYRQPCVSKRGVACGQNLILYPSPEGLVMVGDDGLAVVTSGIMTREQWASYSPESMVGFWTRSAYVGFIEGTGQGIVLEVTASGLAGISRVSIPGKRVFGGWIDQMTDALYLLCDSGSGTAMTVEQFSAGQALAYTWKSKVFTFSSPASMAACRLRGEWVSGVTLRVWGDGALFYSGAVASNEPFRLPDAVYRSLEFELSGTDVVTEVVLAQSMEELV